jgi:hypothetical protein
MASKKNQCKSIMKLKIIMKARQWRQYQPVWRNVEIAKAIENVASAAGNRENINESSKTEANDNQ